LKLKGRPKKIRTVEDEPKILSFSPRGKPGRPDEANLKYEELEAIRLADHDRLKHLEAAARMGISRQSFGRVLNKARGTVAGALVSGKIIRVAGGTYKISKDRGKAQKRAGAPADHKK